MIPRLRPSLGAEELVAAILSRGTVDEFEGSFAQLVGQKHAIAFPYGRTGLMLLLEALGLNDREIICPAFTCVVVPHAIVYSGNQPVFVDSREADFNMDLDLAEAAISEHTGAIIPTSIYGYPVDLDRLSDLRRRHPDIIVIQDCAHSFAAEWQGRPVQRAGDAAIFGLNISKIITSIFGGMVTTDRDDIAARLRRHRDQRLGGPTRAKGFLRATYLLAAVTALCPPVFTLVDRAQKLGLLDRFTKYYDPGRINMPRDFLTAMTDVEASVGLVQLDRYASIIDHRRRIAGVYDEALRDSPGLRPPPLIDGATYSHYSPILQNRAAVMAAMSRRGIELGHVIEYCIPDMQAYRNLNSSPCSCPVAQAFSEQVINLPLHVAPDVAVRVAEALKVSMEDAGATDEPTPIERAAGSS